jgi:hypothetical protein
VFVDEACGLEPFVRGAEVGGGGLYGGGEGFGEGAEAGSCLGDGAGEAFGFFGCEGAVLDGRLVGHGWRALSRSVMRRPAGVR